MDRARFVLLLVATLAGCGARTGLGVATRDAAPDAAPDAATACGDFPPIPSPAPPTPGAACTALAALAGDDLVALAPQGTFTTLFHFGAASGTSLSRIVVSRGDYLGALRVVLSPSSTLDVEFAEVRLDGALVAHHHQSFGVQSWGGMFGVMGNAAGTFAFGAGMGDLGKVWVTLAEGSLLGPFGDIAIPYGGLFSPRVDPDVRGRFLVLPVGTNSTADLDWFDPCSGTRRAAFLPANGYAMGTGGQLFGITHGGQLSKETADGVTALAYPSLGAEFAAWDFAAPYAMFAIPPYSGGASANLLLVNAETLGDAQLSLAYPGLSVVPPGAWLSTVGDSNNPAGFGLDSQGHVTMFLADTGGTIHLEITSDGSTWTPVGTPVSYDPVFAPSYSLDFAEAAGTYVVQGSAPSASGKTWQVVRPAAGVDVPLQGPGRIAHDGGCVAALVSSTELSIVNATNGQLTKIALPSAVETDAWVSTWIPGDDAVLAGP